MKALVVGTRVKLRGLDMDCHQVVCSSTIVRVLDEPTKPRGDTPGADGHITIYDCVVESDEGLRMFAESSLFLDESLATIRHRIAILWNMGDDGILSDYRTASDQDVLDSYSWVLDLTSESFACAPEIWKAMVYLVGIEGGAS